MQLVERHLIKPGHPYYQEVDQLSFWAKNLYNSALYIYRQNFFQQQTTSANQVYHLLKVQTEYQVLPAKVSQSVLRLVDQAWSSYYQALDAAQAAPNSFPNLPRIPNYKGSRLKERKDGRYVVIYNYQAVSKKAFKKGLAHPSQTKIYLPTKAEEIKEIRIVPKGGYYVLEVVYEKEEKVQESDDSKRIAALDLGLNNLATLTTNVEEIQPQIYDGRAIKSANQYANKKNAQLRSLLPESQKSSKRLEKLWLKRNCKVDYYLHTTSEKIISQLVNQQISLLVIGWNPEIKDKINLGRVNNQKFVSIPHKRLIEMLQYKGQLEGIKVVLTEESYTSVCSALDLEPLTKQSSYQGKRVKRGLFRTANGLFLNADLNGALNIGRKVVGNGFIPHPVEAVVVQPVRVKAYKSVA